MTLERYHTAVVTGSSGGIGAAVVRALAESGLTVYAVARDADALKQLAARTGAIPVPLDVTDGDAVLTAFATTPVDVMVYCSGAVGGGMTVWDHAPEDVARMMNVAVAGFINCVRAMVPGMHARSHGHIVALGSVAGHYPTDILPVYGAAKAAIYSLTQSLRHDLYGTNVRVTEIIPGRVEASELGDILSDVDLAEAMRYRDYQCLQPEDVAATAMFALSAPARVDVTHIEVMPTHQVNGGMRFFKGEREPHRIPRRAKMDTWPFSAIRARRTGKRAPGRPGGPKPR